MKIYDERATIAAIATGQAEGGIGVIRVSGADALVIGDRVFRSVNGKMLSDTPGYHAHYGEVYDDSGWYDEAVALVFRAPKSYTGEDVVELSCHGGLTVTRQALGACIAAGAIPAQPGEFTRRAFENGRISLTQAEAVMSVISAEGKQAAIAAGCALEGRLQKRIDGVIDKLKELAVALSVWCDYPDEEEVPAVTEDMLNTELTEIHKMLGKLVSEGQAGVTLQAGIDAAICGKPNVGKSTLMNLLSGCEKSIVTSIAGTTRDIVDNCVMVGDCVLRLYDTAGIRNTDDIIENIGVERARKKMQQCSLIIAVFDGSEPLDNDDRQLIDEVSQLCTIAIVNKADRQLVADTEYIRSKVPHTVVISAQNGSGLEQLEMVIKKVTGLNGLDPQNGLIINQRQLSCAKTALDCIEQALEAVQTGVTFDAVNVLVYDAIDRLYELTGQRVNEEVVDEIFRRFCLGK